MSMVRTLLGPLAIYSITNALSSAIPFFLLPVLTRVLTPVEYGLVAMFTIMVGVFRGITGLNVHGAVGITYFKREGIDFGRYVSTCLLILVVSTTTVLLLAWLVLPWLERLTDLSGPWILVSVLVACAYFVIQTRLVIWQSARQPIPYGLMRVTQSALDAGFALWFVLALKWGWEGRVGSVALAALAAAVWALFSLRRDGLLPIGATKAYAMNALRYGVPLVPNAIGAMVIGAGDRIIVSGQLGTQALGIYTVGWQIGMVVGMLGDAFVKAYGPWQFEQLKENDAERSLRLVGATYLTFVFFALVSVGAYVFLYFFGEILLGAKFVSALAIIHWFIIGNMFSAMSYAVVGLIHFSSRTELASLVTVVCGATGLLVDYVLARLYGIEGAAIGFASVNALTFLATWATGARLYDLPWRRPRAAVLALTRV